MCKEISGQLADIELSKFLVREQADILKAIISLVLRLIAAVGHDKPLLHA